MSEHISASQLTMWLRCPKQYEYRYIDGVKLPPKAALTRGSACHKAWETNHLQKIKTKQDLPAEQVLSVYSDEFDRRAPETEWEPDEDAGKEKDLGARMTSIYHEQVSAKVQPIACEAPFEIDLCGHIVQGFIDLITDKGQLRDAKTASRKKSSIPTDYQLQMAIYAEALPEAQSFCLDTAIATEKRAELETLTLAREDLPSDRLTAYLDAFGESLLKGYFPPTNPDNWCCSEKWCGFWRMCPYGGGRRA